MRGVGREGFKGMVFVVKNCSCEKSPRNIVPPNYAPPPMPRFSANNQTVGVVMVIGLNAEVASSADCACTSVLL